MIFVCIKSILSEKEFKIFELFYGYEKYLIIPDRCNKEKK